MKKNKIKQELEILNSAISSLAARVKEIEGNKKQVNEPLSELPDKWAIGKIEGNEAVIFMSWINKNKETDYVYSEEEIKESYFHFPTICFGHTANYVDDDYTEISFSDFERLVLKKGELEVGKWYKYELANALACYGGSFTGYGFVNKKWCLKGIQISDIPNWKPATNEEVEAALIEEAKRRGFKDGVKVNRSMFEPIISNNVVIKGHTFSYFYPDTLEIGRNAIYDKGIWATIVEEPKQEIDWSVPGQLVCNENGAIWLTSGKHNEDKFYATLIVSKSGKPKGRYSEKVSKEDMIGLYKGSITLSNEPI